MTKSYNDIKEQEQRILLLCQERGRYCDNAKKRVDTQRLAQITRRTLTQHGFPIFGNFDRGEKRPYIVQNAEKPKEAEAPAIRQVNEKKKDTDGNCYRACNVPRLDECKRRKPQKDTRRLPPRVCRKNVR